MRYGNDMIMVWSTEEGAVEVEQVYTYMTLAYRSYSQLHTSPTNTKTIYISSILSLLSILSIPTPGVPRV